MEARKDWLHHWSAGASSYGSPERQEPVVKLSGISDPVIKWLIAWNLPWWEYLHREIGKHYKSEPLPFPQKPVFTHLSPHPWLATFPPSPPTSYSTPTPSSAQGWLGLTLILCKELVFWSVTASCKGRQDTMWLEAWAWSQTCLGWVPVLLPLTYVTLGKFLNLSIPRFPPM